jgi:hypothetical protein
MADGVREEKLWGFVERAGEMRAPQPAGKAGVTNVEHRYDVQKRFGDLPDDGQGDACSMLMG